MPCPAMSRIATQRVRGRRTALAILMFALAAAAPGAMACGWWGDGENDDDLQSLVVGGNGAVTGAQDQTEETPAELTLEANNLRRFGYSGYAGAARLYREAALAGYAPAQNNLGDMYARALGVPRDYKAALMWFQRAAEQGEPHAQHSLAMMLIEGQGVAADPDGGLTWLERSARAGHKSACADLASIYTDGRYVERDLGKARFWWRKAAALGHPDAEQALRALNSNKAS